MCIAICALPYKELTDDQLKNSAENNPDGFGFTYVRQDACGIRKLIVKKSMDYKIFYRQYKRAFKNNPESVFLLHFRIATHGTVNKFNCHPFFINKDMSFIHNGIISGVGTDKDMSDTQLFNEKVLKKLPEGWESSPSIRLLIEKFLVGSKLITLDVDNNYQIYNEHAGHWKEGVWYSNYSYSYGKVGKFYAPTTTVYRPTTFGKEKLSFCCDGCGVKHNEFDLTFFVSRGEPFCYCKDCVTVAYFNGTVNLTDKVGKSRFAKVMKDYTYHYGTEDYGESRFMD